MPSAIYRITIALLALLTAQPAWADWYEASSDHFVIYADDKERDIQRFAEELERYHSAMASLTGRATEKPSPSNRVVIYVVGSQRDIRELAGGNSRTIAGLYIPRAGAAGACSRLTFSSVGARRSGCSGLPPDDVWPPLRSVSYGQRNGERRRGRTGSFCVL